MSYTIAEYGTEVMKIDDNGGIYVHYTGPADNHLIRLAKLKQRYMLFIICVYRETMVHLKCDQSVKDAILTTTGDEKIILEYVSSSCSYRHKLCMRPCL